MGLKWFTKSLFFSLGLVLLLIMFFSVNSSTFNLSQDRAGAYAGCGGSVINFIGKNDDIIYSVDLPANKSLNDLENANLLKNSDFNGDFKVFNSSSSGMFKFIDSWYIGWGNSSVYVNSSGLKIDVNSSFVNIMTRHTPFDKSGVYSLTFSGDENMITYYKQSWVLYKSLSQKKVIYVSAFNRVIDNNSISSNFYLSDEILADVDGSFEIGIQFKTGSNINLYWSKFEYGKSATPYYSSDYVQKLYGEKLDNYVWSMSPVNYTPYDFDTHTPSTSLHYVKNKPFFSLVDTWNEYVLMFNNQKSTTQVVLELVKNKWSYMLSLSDNMSSLFASTNNVSVFDSPAGLFNVNGLWYSKIVKFLQYIVGMMFNSLLLIFYSLLLLLCPVIDMVNYVYALIFGNANSWTFLKSL